MSHLKNVLESWHCSATATSPAHAHNYYCLVGLCNAITVPMKDIYMPMTHENLNCGRGRRGGRKGTLLLFRSGSLQCSSTTVHAVLVLTWHGAAR